MNLETKQEKSEKPLKKCVKIGCIWGRFFTQKTASRQKSDATIKCKFSVDSEHRIRFLVAFTVLEIFFQDIRFSQDVHTQRDRFLANVQKVLKNAHFCTLWMNQIFFRQTAVWVSCLYSKELSCKNSKKSLEPFLRKSDY